MVRENYNKSNDANRKIIYEMERIQCKEIIQKEKRSFLNEILKVVEKTHLQGSIRNFFRTIMQYT